MPTKPKKALLMGLNYTGTKSALNGCENDVKNIKEFLLKHDYKEENIRIMTEDCKGDDIPTKGGILKAIEVLLKDCDKDSEFFVHYSGHGSFMADYSRDEEDSKDECICPLDYEKSGFITDDQLKKCLIENLNGAKLICLFDCCHSATILDLRYNYVVDLSNNEDSSYTVITNKRSPKVNSDVLLISGCVDSSYSADAYIGSKKEYRGALTHCFLETFRILEENKKESTYKQVFKGISLLMKNSNFAQVTQLSTGDIVDLKKLLTI